MSLETISPSAQRTDKEHACCRAGTCSHAQKDGGWERTNERTDGRAGGRAGGQYTAAGRMVGHKQRPPSPSPTAGVGKGRHSATDNSRGRVPADTAHYADCGSVARERHREQPRTTDYKQRARSVLLSAADRTASSVRAGRLTHTQTVRSTRYTLRQRYAVHGTHYVNGTQCTVHITPTVRNTRYTLGTSTVRSTRYTVHIALTVHDTVFGL